MIPAKPNTYCHRRSISLCLGYHNVGQKIMIESKQICKILYILTLLPHPSHNTIKGGGCTRNTAWRGLSRVWIMKLDPKKKKTFFSCWPRRLLRGIDGRSIRQNIECSALRFEIIESELDVNEWILLCPSCIV